MLAESEEAAIVARGGADVSESAETVRIPFVIRAQEAARDRGESSFSGPATTVRRKVLGLKHLSSTVGRLQNVLIGRLNIW